MAGRPSKPKHLKVVQGTYRKDRANPNEPEPNGELGKPPRRLDADQRKAWQEIVDDCCPGVLAKSDRIAVEIAAVLLAHFRHKPEDFNAAKLTRLSSLLGKFGMTPAERAHINVSQPSTVSADPWENI